MVFDFIKYVRPIWQFNIDLPTEVAIMPPNCMEREDIVCHVDLAYETLSAQLADLSYRMINTGYLLETKSVNWSSTGSVLPPSLKDEYIFVKKYWGIQWAFFTLLKRLIALYNPIKEVKAFLASRRVEKVRLFENVKDWSDYDSFESATIDSNPIVTVIIPTLNRYTYLLDALKDLERQTYKNVEVIVVDQSDNFNPVFYTNFDIKIRLIRQPNKALWTARNEAIKMAEGDFILLFDDDSRVRPDWITQHLKCLDYFNADVSAGVSFAVHGGKISKSYNFFRLADQFDSGNAMLRRRVFEKTGLFDQCFNGMRMGDGEFGFRLYRNGINSISNPKASRIHIKAREGGLRDMGSWDGFRVKKFLDPKPVPSVLYLYRKYFPHRLYKHAVFMGIIFSNVPYRFKGNSSMLLLSIAIAILKSPLLLIQYRKSFRIAKQMKSNIPVLLPRKEKDSFRVTVDNEE